MSEKEEYIAKCLMTDKTKEECEELWTESQKTVDQPVGEMPDVVKRIADLERANKEKDEKIKHLVGQVAEANTIVSGIQKERNAADEAERQRLIWKISKDSRGYLRKDQLSKLNLYDLRLIHKNFKRENAQDYVDYFKRRQQRDQAGKGEPDLSVGEYDPKKKQYKRGI